MVELPLVQPELWGLKRNEKEAGKGFLLTRIRIHSHQDLRRHWTVDKAALINIFRCRGPSDHIDHVTIL